ncbi:MAG: hypothetical protein Q7J54_08160 [Candidatus Woesearchaeota archaeon]|nr:hypothetical protein [Candidatus Woesearchaeota archaeon]
MKNKLKLIILGITLMFLFGLLFGTVIAVKNKIYELNLEYNNGIITSKEIVVKPISIPEKRIQPTIGYNLELISFSNEILDSFKFEIPLTIFVDRIDPQTGEMTGEAIRLDKTEFILKVPYFKNGKTINIYDPNNTKVLSVDVGHFAVTCPNNICEPNENYKTCPQDCPYINKNIFIFVVIGIIAIIIFVLIWIYLRKSSQP